MKYLIYLFPLLLLLSCTRKANKPIQQETPEIKPPVADAPVSELDSLMKALEEAPVEAPPYLVAVLEKTACYGKCPAFEARLFSNGRLTYLGKREVERIGRYEAWTDVALIEKIKTAAYDLRYFELSDVYPTNQRQIEDIPLTITYLNFDEKEKTIINNYGSPKALRDFEDLLEQMLLEVNWKKLPAARSN